MPTQPVQKTIHPIAVFKEARSVCRKNLGKLSALYLIFNLPITLISLSAQFKSLMDQKPGLTVWLWFLLIMVISSWGHIALLLGAQKAVGAQNYTIGQSINRAQIFLVKYLALLVSLTLFFLGLLIAIGISVALALAFLSQINKILAALACLILIIVLISFLVFFLLRWSLASLACVFENAWPMPALKSSFSLVKDQINPLTGLYGLMILVYIAGLAPMLIAQAFSGVSQETSPAQTSMIIYIFLINIVLVPLWTMITVVLYNKLKEVFGDYVHA